MVLKKIVVVPARAGMSPGRETPKPLPAGGPRASGDEPYRMKLEFGGGLWSPRERG